MGNTFTALLCNIMKSSYRLAWVPLHLVTGEECQ